MIIEKERVSEPPPEDERNALFYVLLGVALTVMVTATAMVAWTAHYPAHGNHPRPLSAINSSASVAPVAGGGGVTPPAGHASTEPPSGTGTEDLCKDVAAHPEAHTFAEAMMCLGTTIGGGVVAAILPKVIADLIIEYLLLCVALPLLLLILAWVLWYIADRLEKTSKDCTKRRHWWQKLWCHVKRVLVWVFRIVAILAVIAAIVLVVACLVMAIGALL